MIKMPPFTFMLVFLLGCGAYIGVRLWQIAPFGQTLKTVFMTAVILLFLSFILSFVWGNQIPVNFTKVLYKTGSAWFFVCIYLLLVFLLIDLVRLTHLVKIDEYIFHNRYFFISFCALITLVMSAGYVNYRHKVRAEISVKVTPNIPDKTMKIVAISDLHLGYGIGNNELKKWVELINAENADLILIAGDLIDNSLRPVKQSAIAETLRTLRAKHGVYAVLGNHEYISGVDEYVEFIENANITLLRDTMVQVNGVYLAGRDDRRNKSRKSLQNLVQNGDAKHPIILLDHQPSNLDEAMNNRIALQISGHTHRGQIFPINLLTDRLFEVSHGYFKKQNTHYYVSSGIGLWGGKFRIGSQSEYAVITFEW